MEDFFEMAKEALVPLRIADTRCSVPDFLPLRYQYDRERLFPAQPDPYLRLAGGGHVEKSSPFALTIRPFGSLFILYSLRGGGQLDPVSAHGGGRADPAFPRGAGGSSPIREGDILICCGSAPFRLQSTLLPWAFCLYFAVGPGLACFSPFLERPYQTTKNQSPVIASFIEKLGRIPEAVSAGTLLEMHRLLTEILSDACLAALPKEQAPDMEIPSYLRDMYTFIHDFRNRSFSLADLENRYGISRYRLGREYKAAFCVSPLKDFNRVRIDEAKKLLRTTDLQVQEVSSRVGYENVNHFIHLFKSETGMTPGAFRALRPETR